MTSRLLAALLGVLLAAACATAREPAEDRLKLIDLTPEVTRAWDETASLPDSERVTAFKAHFATILPGFYSHERFGMPEPGPYDERLLAGLKGYPEQRPKVEEASRRFAAMLEPARTSFEREFGPMRGYPPVYLVVSFGEFDGGTRSLPGGSFLMFGADMVAKLHLQHDIRPFFHHELFHLYHSRYFAECEQIWCSLWTEGLAVHVAKTLNPSATDGELLLTQPGPIRPEVDADRTAAVCAVVARLDSADPTAAEALFSFRRLGPGLPPRFGYYVGYLAAAEMGRTRSPQQLARMPATQVRVELEKALRGLAVCP